MGEGFSAIEERVVEVYRHVLDAASRPVREPGELVKRLRAEYKLVVDRKLVTLVVAAFLAGRPVLFEGPPGTGKTELGEAILTLWAGMPAFVIPCSENYNEYRVIGDFHPLMAMQKGFNEESFVPRPLLAAMVLGAGVLVDEIRRSSEEFQNLLLDIIDKRRVFIPELKTVIRARSEGFQVIFTSNPEDYAQLELSDAFLRRVVRIPFSYPPPEVEAEIVRLRYDAGAELPPGMLKAMLRAVSLLRERTLYKPGPSDTALWARVAGRLAVLRGRSEVSREDLFDAAMIVLSKRVGEEDEVERALREAFPV